MIYKNQTALITGASSGIGMEYAKELAKRGTNLVLVARREAALAALAGQLQGEFGIKVATIPLDLSKRESGDKFVQELSKSGIGVDILINNAGFGTNSRVQNEDRSRVQEEIQLNVGTLVDLTAALLPAMLEKNSGAIVNIASTAAFQPVPGMAVYAATKAFVLSFTSALWGEVKGTEVRILTVCPGATATEFFDVAGANPFGKLAPISDVVDATFKALDAKTPKPAVVVGRRNSIMAAASRFIPTKSVIQVAGSMFLKD